MPDNKKPTPVSKPKASSFSLTPEELGSVSQRQTNLGPRAVQADNSKYDSGFLVGGNNPLGDLEEQRGQRQTTADKLLNGIPKLTGTAVTSFVEPFVDLTVGLLEGGKAVAQGKDFKEGFSKLYDNEASKQLDGFTDYLNKEFPMYATKVEEQRGLWAAIPGTTGSANFWFDKVGNGLGFMLGAVVDGYLTGGAADAIKAGKIARGVAKAAELANDVRKGAKEGDAILGAVGKAAARSGRSNALSNIFTGTIGALGESGMEARQIYNDTGMAIRKQLLDDKGLDPNTQDYKFSDAEEAHIKHLQEVSGNTGFAINLALVGGTNALLLPKVFRRGYQAERVALGTIEKAGEEGLYKAATLTGKKRAAAVAFDILKGNLEEATQEQLQYAVEQYLPDYYRKQRDPASKGDVNEYLTSMGQGLSEAYGTKEGWENALLGGIIGLTGAHEGFTRLANQDKATQAAVSSLNDAISKKPQQAMMNSLIGQAAALKQKKEAVTGGDQLRFQNAEFDGFAHLVRGYTQAGKLDDLISSIQEEGQLSPEEYKEKYQLPADSQLASSPAQLAAKQVEKVKQLSRLSNEIEAAYPGDNMQPLRDAFYGISASSQNNKEREQKLSNEVAAIAGISYDAFVLTDKKTAKEKYLAAIHEWIQDPEILPKQSNEVQQKAEDLVDLANERIALAQQYRTLEDPRHREKIFQALNKLEELQAQNPKPEEVVADDKPAVVLGPAPTTVPPKGTAVPKSSLPTGDSFDDETPAGGALAGADPFAAAPIPIAPKPAAVVAPGEEAHKFPITKAQGAPEDIEVGIDAAGNVVRITGDGREYADKTRADWTKALAAPIAAEVARRLQPAVDTTEQKRVVGMLDSMPKEGGPKLNESASHYVEGTTEYERASTIKEEMLSGRGKLADDKTFLEDNPQYADRGTISDEIIRDFFIAANKGQAYTAATAKKVYAAYLEKHKERTHKKKGTAQPATVQMTDGFFKELLEQLDIIKATLDKGGYVVKSDTSNLYGELRGRKVAGAMDLVAVAPSGNAFIIDIKTVQNSRREDYKLPDKGQGEIKNAYGNDREFYSTYREGDLIQQATYEELLKQRTGIEVKDRLIFPIIAKVGQDNVVRSAKLEPVDGKYSMSLGAQGELGKMNIYQLMDHYGYEWKAPGSAEVADPKGKAEVDQGTTPGIYPSTLLKLTGLHSNDWTVSDGKGGRIADEKELAEQPRREAWKEAMRANNGQQLVPFTVKVVPNSKKDGQPYINVYTFLNGKPLKLGYINPVALAVRETDTQEVKDAHAQATALRSSILEYAAAHPGENVPVKFSFSASFDSKAEVQTNKPLSELDERFMLPGADGLMRHSIAQVKRSYSVREQVILSALEEGGYVDAGFEEQIKKSGIKDRYVMQVISPSGKVGLIGVNTAELRDPAVYTSLSANLQDGSTEQEQAAFLNERVFLSAKVENGQRQGIVFVGADKKGLVSAKVYTNQGTDEQGNADDTVQGYLRFRGKPEFTSPEEFLEALRYFPSDGSGGQEGLPADTVVSKVRSQLLTADSAQERLAKLVPSTSEKLWKDVNTYPLRVEAKARPVLAKEDTAEEPTTATSKAMPEAAPVFESTVAKTSKPVAAALSPEDQGADELEPALRVHVQEMLQSTDFAEAERYVEKNLPTGEAGFSVKRMVSQTLGQGVSVGYFLDMGLYLADKATAGIVRHEAFHAVFRVLLSDAEQQKYLKLARRFTDLSVVAKDRFRKLASQYATLSDAELEEEMLEERMSRAYEDELAGKPTGFLKSLWNKLSAFLRWLTGQSKDGNAVHEEVRQLFAKIDAAGFKGTEYQNPKSLSKKAAFKALAHMDSYQAEKEVRVLTSDFLNAGGLDAATAADKDAILEKLLNSRKLELAKDSSWVEGDELAQEAILKQRKYYRSTEERKALGETPGLLYPRAYTYTEDRNTLKAEVKKLATEIGKNIQLDEDGDTAQDKAVQQDDNATDRTFDQSMLSQEAKPQAAVKTLLLQAQYTDADGVRQAVDYAPTIGQLYRLLDNTRTFEEQYSKLKAVVAAGNQPQLEAVLKELDNRLASREAPYIASQFAASFYRIHTDARFTLINQKTSGRMNFSANRKSAEIVLADQWKDAVERAASAGVDERRKLTDEVGKALGVVYRPGYSAAENAAGQKRLVSALALVGIDVSPAFVARVIEGNDEQYALNEGQAKLAGKRSLEEDLAEINKQIFLGNNPFERSADNTEGKVVKSTSELKTGGGAVTRGYALAAADAPYRSDLVESSGQDALGKPYFERAQPSFALERGRDIVAGKYNTLDKPWLTYNLVNILGKGIAEGVAKITAQLKLSADVGIREEAEELGVTPKEKDPKTYWLQECANFLTKKGTKSERWITPFQLEAKSSSFMLNVPVQATGTYYDGGITEKGHEGLYHMALQDLENGEAAIAQLYDENGEANSTIQPIEGVHFLAKPLVKNGKELLPGGYDKAGKPILVPLEVLREYQNTGRRELLPRMFQTVSLPSLNKLTNEQLRDKKAVAKELTTLADILIAESKKQLNEVGLDTEGDKAGATNLLLIGKDSEYKTLDAFLGDLLMTNLLWSDAYLRLIVGSEAWFKNQNDATKRMASLIAAGPGMGTVNGKDSHNFAVLETHNSYLDAKTLLPITEEQYKNGVAADKKAGRTGGEVTVRKADATDAQAYWTAEFAKDFFQGIGKLTWETARIWDKIIAGEKLSPGEQKTILDEGVSAISSKAVYASQLNDGSLAYIKFSAHILTKELTSFQAPDGKWYPKPDMQGAHAMREWMMNNNLQAAGHDSAMKNGIRGKNFRDADGHYSGGATSISLPNVGLREQMLNPSGKRKIVYPTQVLQLLDEGMSDTDEVELNGEILTIAQVREKYQAVFAKIREKAMADAEVMAKAVVAGKKLFVDTMRASLLASGVGEAELAFFSHDDAKPGFRHSMDLPSLNKQFQKLFLALYNKGVLSIKAPGGKNTLVTSALTRVVINKATGELAHDWGKDFHEQPYLNKDYSFNSEEYTTRELQMHGPESNEPGAPIRLAEVYLSEELLLNMGMTLKELYALPANKRDSIITRLGMRIPFQSHHSAIPYKVVGWLPAHYGSVVVAPAGITTLSGADYDIDSLYELRKEFWKDKQNNWHVYGEMPSDEDLLPRKAFDKLRELPEKQLSRRLRLPITDKLREQYKDWLAEKQEAEENAYEESLQTAESKHKFSEYNEYQKSNKLLAASLVAVRGSALWSTASQQVVETALALEKLAPGEAVLSDSLRVLRSNLLLQNADDTSAEEQLDTVMERLLELASGHSAIRQKLSAGLATLDSLRQDAYKQVKVAPTLKEFLRLPASKQQTTPALYSEQLDNSLALIRNPHNAASITTPAETDPLTDAAANLAPFRSVSEAESLPYSSLPVRANHQFKALVGKANIGPAALANTVSALLTKHNYNFPVPFYFGGEAIKGYAGNVERDIDITEDSEGNPVVTYKSVQGRKANSLSTLVGAMADNVKEGHAARLNLTKDNLMPFSNLIAQGYGLQRTMLFATQPAMVLTSQRYRATQSIVDRKKGQEAVVNELLNELYGRLYAGKPAPGEGLVAGKKEKKQVTQDAATLLKELRRMLTRLYHPDKAAPGNEAQILEYTKLSQRINAAYDAGKLQELVAIAKEKDASFTLTEEQQEVVGEIGEQQVTPEDILTALTWQVVDLKLDLGSILRSKGPLSESDYQALRRQIGILEDYGQLLTQTKYFKAVSTILSGNKGLGADFTQLEKINTALKLTTLESEPISGGIYMGGIIAKESGLSANLRNIRRVEASLPDNFLSRTGPIKGLQKTVEGLMPRIREEQKQELEDGILTFVAINAYQKMMGPLTKSSFRLADYHYLFEDSEKNLGTQLNELQTRIPQLTKNPYLRGLMRRNPNDSTNLYGVTFNTRQKTSAEMAARYDTGAKELLAGSPLSRTFMGMSMRYLAAKDNFQFKNGTFVKLLPELQFRLLSKQLQAVKEAMDAYATAQADKDAPAMAAANTDLLNLVGYNVVGIKRQFMTLWFANKENSKRVAGFAAGEDHFYGKLDSKFVVTEDKGTWAIPKAELTKAKVERLPSVTAVKKDGRKVLILRGDSEDGKYTYYQEIPQLDHKERSYYHLSKEELQKEATKAKNTPKSSEAQEQDDFEEQMYGDYQADDQVSAQSAAQAEQPAAAAASATSVAQQAPAAATVQPEEQPEFVAEAAVKDGNVGTVKLREDGTGVIQQGGQWVAAPQRVANKALVNWGLQNGGAKKVTVRNVDYYVVRDFGGPRIITMAGTSAGNEVYADRNHGLRKEILAASGYTDKAVEVATAQPSALQAALQVELAVTPEEKVELDNWLTTTKPEMHYVSLQEKVFFIRKKLAGEVVEKCFI